MIQWVALGAIGVALTLAARARSMPWKLVDRRKQAQLTAEAKAHTTTRKASDVYALVLHQMGFSRGNDPARYNRVTAHYIILPDGGTYQLHDLATRLPASSGLNAGSVSVEFAGNFPSRPKSKDPKAFWQPDTMGMDQLSDAQIRAGRELIDYLIREHGITHVLAHRQGGPKRENCPGPDVWREIGGWGVHERNLSWGGEGWAVNNGKPIPAEWWQSPAVDPLGPSSGVT